MSLPSAIIAAMPEGYRYVQRLTVPGARNRFNAATKGIPNPEFLQPSLYLEPVKSANAIPDFEDFVSCPEIITFLPRRLEVKPVYHDKWFFEGQRRYSELMREIETHVRAYDADVARVTFTPEVNFSESRLAILSAGLGAHVEFYRKLGKQ